MEEKRKNKCSFNSNAFSPGVCVCLCAHSVSCAAPAHMVVMDGAAAASTHVPFEKAVIQPSGRISISAADET